MSKKSSEQDQKEKKTQESRSINKKPSVKKSRIGNTLLIIVMAAAPALILLGISGYTNYQTQKNTYEAVKQEIDSYYFNGWPVESTRTRFDEDYPHMTFITYVLDWSHEKTLPQYRNELHYTIDREMAYIEESLVEAKEDTANLYVEEIAQSTDILESWFRQADEGIDTHNYDMVTSSLYAIHAETDRLNKLQDEDIQDLIEKKVSTVESINLVGAYYYLDFSTQVAQAKEIAQSDKDPLQIFLELDELKKSTASELDEKFTARGGWGTSGKRIFITIGSQHLYMIEDYDIVYDMPASTGISGHGTGVGEFQVYDKVDMAWGYYEIWMPYWLTIYYSGGLENGIHGIPISPVSGRWSHWDSVVGVSPITYGCVMPHDWDAKIVYEWAEIGIPVSIVY